MILEFRPIRFGENGNLAKATILFRFRLELRRDGGWDGSGTLHFVFQERIGGHEGIGMRVRLDMSRRIRKHRRKGPARCPGFHIHFSEFGKRMEVGFEGWLGSWGV